MRLQIGKKLMLPTFSGYYVRALLFNILKRADPESSIKVHSSREYTFSTTPFIQGNRFRFTYLSPGEATFYFYTTKKDVFKLLAKAFYSEPMDHVLLRDRPYPILEFRMFDAELRPARIPLSFRVDFLTPTYFKRSGNVILYPDPPLMVKNLAKLAGMDEEDAFRWALVNLRVSSFPKGIRTVEFREPKSSVFMRGFLGSVNFSLKEEDPDWSGRLPILLELAKYIGVGGGRSMGFGRVLIKPYGKKSDVRATGPHQGHGAAGREGRGDFVLAGDSGLRRGCP